MINFHGTGVREGLSLGPAPYVVLSGVCKMNVLFILHVKEQAV